MMKPMNKQAAIRHPKKTTHTEEDSPALWVRHIGKSLLITLLAAVLLTVSLSLVAYFYSDPDRLIRPLGLFASGLTALIGGFAATRIHGHAALLCGLFNGSCTMALMILLSLFLGGHAAGYSVGISLLLHVGFLALSVLGAYLGLRKKPKKTRKF